MPRSTLSTPLWNESYSKAKAEQSQHSGAVCVCAELPWNVRVHLRGVSRNRRDSTHIYTVHFEAAIIVL